MLRPRLLAVGSALLSGVLAAAEPSSKVTAIYAMDADGAHAREVARIPGFPVLNSPEVSPDGRLVAVDGRKDGEGFGQARILIVELATGAVEDLGPGAMPSWSDDGRWIAFCRYNPRSIYIRSLETGQERLVDQNGWGVQWSPEGARLAYTRDGDLVIYDLTTDVASEVKLSETYSTIYWNCRWSPAGDEICFMGQRKDVLGTSSVIAIVTLGDTPRESVQCNAAWFHPDIAWQPNSQRIAVPRKSAPGSPGQIYVFDAHSSRDPVPLAGQPADRENSGLCWSRDGKTLYFLSRK